MSPFVTLDDYEVAARERLPADAYDVYAGGAGDEWSLAENRRAFDRWRLRPRVLCAAGNPGTSTSVLGTSVSFPVLVAPWAYQSMAHIEGERATSRAAAATGTIMVVSSTGSHPRSGRGSPACPTTRCSRGTTSDGSEKGPRDFRC